MEIGDVVPKKKKRVAPLLPPKKPKRTPVPISVPTAKVVEKPQTALVPVQKKDVTSRGFLRFAAGVLYANSSQMSVADMAKHPVLGQVPVSTLQRWCVEDNWENNRQKTIDYFRDYIAEQIGAELIQTRRRELAVMTEIFQGAVDRLTLSTPRSYEGMVHAIVKLAALMSDWRDKLQDQLPLRTPKTIEEAEQGIAESNAANGIGEAVQQLNSLAQLTPEEAKMLGRELMRARRITSRAKNKPPDEGTDPENG